MTTNINQALKNANIGTNYKMLGSKSSCCAKKAFLSYTDTDGWKVKRLNIFEQFLRNGLGLYGSTHLDHVVTHLAKASRRPPKLIERMDKLWKESYPNAGLSPLKRKENPKSHFKKPARTPKPRGAGRQPRPVRTNRHTRDSVAAHGIALFGDRSNISELAQYFKDGPVFNGLLMLDNDYKYHEIPGDGHCLFRSIAAGIALGLSQGEHETWIQLQEQIDTTLDMVGASEDLKKSYEYFKKNINKLFSLPKPTSVEKLMRDQDASDRMVKFLRLLACEYNAVSKDKIADFVPGKSVDKYLKDMKRMSKPQMGGHIEIQALVESLGLEITLLDVDGMGKGGSTDQQHYKHKGYNTSVGLHLLYTPLHYNLAVVA